MPASPGLHAQRLGTAPVDVSLLPVAMASTLVRRLTAELSLRQMGPEAAAFVVIRLPITGRERIVLSLRGDVDGAVRLLRQAL